MLNRDEVEVVLFTLEVAALATVLIFPLALLAALALARYRGPGKGALETILPLNTKRVDVACVTRKCQPVASCQM